MAGEASTDLCSAEPYGCGLYPLAVISTLGPVGVSASTLHWNSSVESEGPLQDWAGFLLRF